MMHAIQKRGIAVIGALLFLTAAAFSQNISYQNPAGFFVCDNAPFSVTLNNTSGAALTGVTVTVNFTTSSGNGGCGVVYLPGTVGGATENDISDLGAPVFSVSNMAAGAIITLNFSATAGCATAACIDDAEFFINQITMSWAGGSTTVTTNPFIIERPLLVITAVNSTVMLGSLGDMLFRKITIRNTRPGALQNFIFTDSHPQGGIAISSSQGTVQPAGANVFQIQLDGSDFSAIGDGDNLFELNEVIVITEKITVIDCGVNIFSSVSNITAGWGCGGAICQQVSINAIVTISLSESEPNLIFEPTTYVPECFCGPQGYPQSLKITNIGDGVASNLQVQVYAAISPSPVTGVFPGSIAVDSAGIAIPFQLIPGFPDTFDLPCISPGPTVGNFVATVLQLAPGASVTLHWDDYFCDLLGCQQPLLRWIYRYSYDKACPPAQHFQSNNITVNEESKFILTNIQAAPSDSLLDDSVYTIHYNVQYDSLDLLDDQLTVEIILPCGFTWVDDNELLLDGQPPTDMVLTQGDTFLTVTATYQLPLPDNDADMQFDVGFNCEDVCFEINCIDSLETTCLAKDTCTSPPIIYYGFEIVTTVEKCTGYPHVCNMQYCDDVSWVYGCPIDSFCITAPPGYVNYAFDARRKNYGLPDNDNNQLADGGGNIDFDLVKIHRAIAGDSIRVSLRGEVIKDLPAALLRFGQVTVDFTATQLSAGNAANLLNTSGIVPAGLTLRIYDKSANLWYNCNSVPAMPQVSAILTYEYDLSPQALAVCGMPSNFTYDTGDSIIFIADYHLEYNLKRDFDGNPLQAILTVSPSMLVWEDPDEIAHYDCGCNIREFEVSGYEYTLLPGIFGIPQCANSAFVGGSLLSFVLETGNYFPYEYRHLLTVQDWQMELPTGFTLVQAKITNIIRQGGAQVVVNQPLTWTFSNGAYHFNLAQYQAPPIEEGFSIFMQYIFDGLCSVSGSNPITYTTHLNFDNHLPEPEDPLELESTSNSLRALTPNLDIQELFTDLISFNNQLVFDFDLVNTPTVVASQSSGPAPDAWLYVVSPTGKVTDFQLINLTTGLPVPSVNGVFQLGNFPIGTMPFQLIGTNNSCVTETLEIHYGWNCDPFNSNIAQPCYEQIQIITITSPPGEIDFFVESPTACSDLCDTIPYHSMEIFNAQLGAVYHLTATVILPPGFSVLSGSCQVELPTGSGNFVPLADPTLINPSTAQWNLSDLLPALANGLPGVSSAPNNSLTIRFLGETTCDFIANAFILATIAAEQNCGIASNTVSKPGMPICITGVSQPYTTNINVDSAPGFGCNDEVSFEVTLSSSAVLPAGACIVVTLPPGIVFQNGSCASACQPNFNCNPTLEGNNLTWQLPAGVTPNQVACFTFNTTGWSALGCTDGVVLFQSAAQTQALCVATGQICSVKVSTGSSIFPYNIMRPAFDLDNFLVNASQNGPNDDLAYSISVTNNGAVNEPPLIIEFYIDTDGDGDGDLLVNTKNALISLANGETESVNGSFSIPGGNLCNLIAYIAASQQCACAGDSAYVSFPVTYQTQQMYTVCSGANLTVGVDAVAGFGYQWSPDDCLDDENAATTVFNCLNNSLNPVTYSFHLTAGNTAGCVIEHLLEVTIQPVPGIFYFESPICLGETANLIASNALLYNWQGPGITDPPQQVQSVTPAATATYNVTVTDAVGCSGTDAVTIVVNPVPVADAGDDAGFCPGQMPQLNAVTGPDYDYMWMPGVPVLNDDEIPNPVVLLAQNNVFTLTVTNGFNCTATDEVSITFNDSLQLVMPADRTICLGSSTTLTASGADTYVWTPAGMCLTPNCSSVVVTPAANTTYTLAAATADGCTATGTVTVNVTTGTIVTNGPSVSICEGETAVINGEQQSEPGIYCDTFQLASGCDSAFCVELLVNPNIDTLQFTDTICQGASVDFEGETYDESGFYCATFTAPNGCDSTRCLALTVLPAPPLTLLATDTVNLGDTVQLSISPSTYDSIVWSGGNIDSFCLNVPACIDSLLETTTYTVTVWDANGCTASASKSIAALIQCDPELAEIPSAFSPNNDQLNDGFDLVGPGEELIINMRIWNRWGQKVYEGTGPWDGFFKGEPAVGDVFVYLIRVGCPAGVEKGEREVKGDVTLLR